MEFKSTDFCQFYASLDNFFCFFQFFVTFRCLLVLIETSWNVKRGQAIATPVENIVLIETSWNVKFWKGRRN